MSTSNSRAATRPTAGPKRLQFHDHHGSHSPCPAPRVSSVLRAGMTGWMKFWASPPADDPIVGTTTMGLLGAMITYNPNAGLSGSVFNQGHNLHKLTRGGDVALIVPVFPPTC